MKHLARFLAASACSATMAPFTIAHFKLLEPPSAIVERDNGDPQKMAPCGGNSANAARGTAADLGTPSNIVTKVRGGTKLHLKVQETDLSPRSLPCGAGSEFAFGTSQGSGSDDRRSPREGLSRYRPSFRILFDRRFLPTVFGHIQHGRPGPCRPGKRTSTFPTSIARNAPYRSFSSWQNTA